MTIVSKISDVKMRINLKKPKFEDKYCLGSRLGSGSFASVYRCEETIAEGDDPSKKVKGCLAAKVFDRMSDSDRFREFRMECKILKSIPPHENCVKMLDAFEECRYCYLVMEKCSISLQAVLHFDALVNHNASAQDLKHAFKSMLTGVNHLHNHGIVHRDIKPANILLAQGRTLSGRPTIKICDMGLAAKLPAGGRLTEVCGSAAYMAPEMLNMKGYGTSVDVWSCGVVAYMMVLGVLPYGEGCFDKRKVQRLICRGSQLPDFKAQNGLQAPSLEAVKFLGSLLNRDPVVRSSAQRALTSPYLNSSASTPMPSTTSTTVTILPKRMKNSKSSLIAALALEFYHGKGVRHDESVALRRHSVDVAEIAGPALDVAVVMRSPTLADAVCVEKFEDELETRVSCCSTKDDEDDKSVMSRESTSCGSDDEEPRANAMPALSDVKCRAIVGL